VCGAVRIAKKGKNVGILVPFSVQHQESSGILQTFAYESGLKERR